MFFFRISFAAFRTATKLSKTIHSIVFHKLRNIIVLFDDICIHTTHYNYKFYNGFIKYEYKTHKKI